jgi:sodium transport system permease protein
MKRPVFERGPLSTPQAQGLLVFSLIWFLSVVAVPTTSDKRVYWNSITLQLVIVGGVPLAFSWLQRMDFASVYKWRHVLLRNVLLSLVISGCLFVLLDAIEDLQNHFIPRVPEVDRKIAAFLTAESPSHLMLVLVSMALVPSICEEICFRGFLLDRFFGKDSKGLSIVMTSVMFGLFHQDYSRILSPTLAGVLLAWLVIRTGSLYTAIIVHFGVNAWGIIVLNSTGRYWLSRTDGKPPTPFWLIALCVLGIYIAFRKATKKESPIADSLEQQPCKEQLQNKRTI